MRCMGWTDSIFAGEGSDASWLRPRRTTTAVAGGIARNVTSADALDTHRESAPADLGSSSRREMKVEEEGGHLREGGAVAEHRSVTEGAMQVEAERGVHLEAAAEAVIIKRIVHIVLNHAGLNLTDRDQSPGRAGRQKEGQDPAREAPAEHRYVQVDGTMASIVLRRWNRI